MSYLIDKYKNKYRLMCEYDRTTNTFPRKLNGTFEDIDVYIACQRNIRVFYYGRGILHAYIPSVNMGNNIVRQIYATYINASNSITETKERMIGGRVANVTSYKIKDESVFSEDIKRKDSIIFDVQSTDEEVMFKFRVSDDEKILPLLKPKTEAASRSPFSSKNLPKSKYDIPEEDLAKYKNVISKLSKENVLKVGFITNDFIKSLTTKKNTIKMIKADMAQKCLKGKEYIHSINKWDEYIKYLDKEVDNICNM